MRRTHGEPPPCTEQPKGEENSTSLIAVFWVGYSWDIRGVFMGYSWGIHMYRVCVGYVSGMYRECVESDWARGGRCTNHG